MSSKHYSYVTRKFESKMLIMRLFITMFRNKWKYYMIVVQGLLNTHTHTNIYIYAFKFPIRKFYSFIYLNIFFFVVRVLLIKKGYRNIMEESKCLKILRR